MGKYDYTGKRVYMGIDVHKKTYAVVTLCQGDKDIEQSIGHRLTGRLIPNLGVG